MRTTALMLYPFFPKKTFSWIARYLLIFQWFNFSVRYTQFVLRPYSFDSNKVILLFFRHNSMNGHPRFMLQSDFHIGFKAFQLLMRKRVTAWLDKINQALPSILIHDEHSKIESPKGKEIYKGLINHKSKTMRRAIRSFINHNFKRLEYEFLNGVTFHKKVARPTTILHSTELFGWSLKVTCLGVHGVKVSNFHSTE